MFYKNLKDFHEEELKRTIWVIRRMPNDTLFERKHGTTWTRAAVLHELENELKSRGDGK